MASSYHPLYGGLWQSPHLEGLSFECKAFFAFLCGNDRCRPSGIYRATDAQLAADTGLPIPKVRQYLAALSGRGRIVRDGAWVFVVGYFERQPKQENLLKGAERDVRECTSTRVLAAWSQRYPARSQWSANGRATVGHPMNEIRPTDAVTDADADADAEQRNGTPPVARPTRGFQIPTSVQQALDRAPRLGADPRLRVPAYWQAELRANPGVDLAGEVLKAEAWIVANPDRAPRKRLGRFLHSWLERAEAAEA